jgi:uncharacterized protein
MGWGVLVALLVLIGYASRASGGKPPADAAYKYSTAIGGLVQYAIILAVILAIARPEWELFALRRPSSFRRVVTASLVALVAAFVVNGIVSAYTNPGGEQGLVPKDWDSSRAAPYVVNFIVFVAVAPVVEEMTFRGLGYSLLEPLGAPVAVVSIGLLFGLAHGLLEALPVLVVFGAGLAFIRSRTGSIYPGIAVHATFNAVALIGSLLT